MHKILLIDDDENLVRLLGEQLKEEDFALIAATDGTHGLRTAHAQKPDLIILDLMLPGGGLAVLRNLKLSTYTNGIPVFVLTGSTDDELRDLIIKTGVDDFIYKPHEIDVLIKKMKESLSAKVAGKPGEGED